jgi:hypothetical protein
MSDANLRGGGEVSSHGGGLPELRKDLSLEVTRSVALTVL